MKSVALTSILGLSFAALSWSQTAAPNTLTECEKSEGFELQFDGKDIETFRKTFTNYVKGSETNNNLDAGWSVSSATEAIVTTGETGDVRSQLKYKDFDWRLEYRNDKNQGLVYRFLTTENYLYRTGIEFAINNNPNQSNPKVITGSAYDMYPNPKKNFHSYSSNLWNEVRIVAIKDSVEHWLNGEKVVGFKYHTADYWKRIDVSKWANVTTFTMKKPGDRNGGYIDNGYIGFQGDHGGKWSLRSMRLNAMAPYFGPAKTTNCSVPNSLAPAQKSLLQFAVESVTGSALRVRFTNANVTQVSLRSTDGKVVPANFQIGQDGRSATLSNWGKPGIYFLHAMAAGKASVSRKIYLP